MDLLCRYVTSTWRSSCTVGCCLSRSSTSAVVYRCYWSLICSLLPLLGLYTVIFFLHISSCLVVPALPHITLPCHRPRMSVLPAVCHRGRCIAFVVHLQSELTNHVACRFASRPVCHILSCLFFVTPSSINVFHRQLLQNSWTFSAVKAFSTMLFVMERMDGRREMLLATM